MGANVPGGCYGLGKYPSLTHKPSGRTLYAQSSSSCYFGRLNRMLIKRVLFLVLGIAMLAIPARAQTVEDSVRINTRVVVVNALVRDSRTHKPVTDLTRENFEVLDDGRPRTISYFGNEGTARQPLALVLVMNLNTDAILYLE